MRYEDFCDEFTKELAAAMLPESVELKRQRINKINAEKDAIVIKFHRINTAPTVYLDELYREYQNGMSVSDIAKKTADNIKSIKNMPSLPDFTPEEIAKNLYCVVINVEENKKLLKDVPYERMEDLAIIARYRVAEHASFIVRNAMCPIFKMTGEEILEKARLNTEKAEYTVQTMLDVLGCLMEPEEMEEVLDQVNEKAPMYVVSNREKTEGAVAIICKSAMEKAYEKIGEDFYVLPSSRHELILIPKSHADDLKHLEELVKEVNRTQLRPEEKLSDHVYEYNERSRKISIAKSKALTHEQESVKEVVRNVGRNR